MVRTNNRMITHILRTIWKSFGRFFAIVLIIALGSALFVGLRITKSDMVQTGQVFTDRQNMFDLRLMNSYGWDKDMVDRIAALDGVVDAEGAHMLDVLASMMDDGEERIYRLYSIPEKINQVYLLGGRMPQRPDECLVDGANANDHVLGSVFTISDENESDTLDALPYKTYTVVGYVSTPLYMDMSRGSTTLGNGTVASYVYIPEEAFDTDYFAEIYVTIPGAFRVYSQEYSDAMDAAAECIKPQITPMAQQRYETLLADARQAYADGMLEYEDGLAEYEKAKREVEQELADALQKLNDGQKELEDNRLTMADAQVQIQEAEQTLQDAAREIQEGWIALQEAKAEAYAQMAQAGEELAKNKQDVLDGLRQVEDGITQIEEALPLIEDGLAQIEEGLPQLELGISLAELQVRSTESALALAKLLGNEERIAQLEAQLEEDNLSLEQLKQQRQEVVAQQAELKKQFEELPLQRQTLLDTKAELEAALVAIEDGYKELETGKLKAEGEFANAESQLRSAELELEDGEKELLEQKAQLLDGEEKLKAAQKELDQAWEDYYEGERQAQTELADAWQELEDGKQKLADALTQIQEMSDPEVYALTRDTNVGYLALDNNSDIVSGISRVFPLFFLLIAALVCITTMTRMVEEERTQIGTLKALGYSTGSIVGKYLAYSGLAALLGCGLGVSVGSAIFPNILWSAYCIMFNITPQLELTFDWALSIGVVVSYTLVSGLATWYCCYRTLKEEPAQLIRPKPPTSGKKILLEYIPLWEKLSFLNKVMLRNIFRYRQRLLMMLVGIGGCTALLLTGFGLQDSVSTVADQQYQKVSVYDMEVYFSEVQTLGQQEAFAQALGQDVSDILFFYQASVELDTSHAVRDVNLLVAQEDIRSFVHLRYEEKEVAMPGQGEVLLSIGIAQAMGIDVGETITLRDSNLRTMTLTVSGIYENHVQNYAIVLPETMQTQWGEAPQNQMAYLQIADGVDVHQVGTQFSGMDGVRNITICADQVSSVGKMMEALTLVIITVVVCAGLLAVIVLYNLTNINITERIREIATIKVLGFNAKETSAYVFKENICLSVVGALLGLLGGRALLEFVISQVKIDMVWFKVVLQWPSYVAAVALTILAALVVDWVFHKKLEHINMAEALKSVE